ncbi:hypothetical protein ILUMI_06496 [Ignelater luminosus]|uniref:Uncharacterized protein n=1 Tax=Ignelater luminosus TaxID=2038154 RepID=A0A8K0D5A3_IGNLU|nr:hypothetical protein ILUMI_06496 [Ignelater luminosus]
MKLTEGKLHVIKLTKPNNEVITQPEDIKKATEEFCKALYQTKTNAPEGKNDSERQSVRNAGPEEIPDIKKEEILRMEKTRERNKKFKPNSSAPSTPLAPDLAYRSTSSQKRQVNSSTKPFQVLSHNQDPRRPVARFAKNFSQVTCWNLSSITNSTKFIHGKDDFYSKQFRDLEVFIDKFKTISGCLLSRPHKVARHIDTGDATPIKQQYYQMSSSMLDIVNREIGKMFVMVQKKDGFLRFCFDGRQLNSVTKRDGYSLLYVSGTLDNLRDKDSYEETAFTVTRRGLFEFTVLPSGQNNSRQTLQQLMDNIFGLEFLYERVKDAGLVVNLKKCEFCGSTYNNLGFVVDKRGLKTDPDKVSSIVQFSTTKTTAEVRRFIDMANWVKVTTQELLRMLVHLYGCRKKLLSYRGRMSCLFGIEKYRPYVELTHFKIVTHHCALLWLYEHQLSSVVSDASKGSTKKFALKFAKTKVAEITVSVIQWVGVQKQQRKKLMKSERRALSQKHSGDLVPKVSSGEYQADGCKPYRYPATSTVFVNYREELDHQNPLLCCDQLDRVYEILRNRYPILINRNKVLMLQDNAPAHRFRLVQEKLQTLERIEVIPHPAHSPDLAPSDYGSPPHSPLNYYVLGLTLKDTLALAYQYAVANNKLIPESWRENQCAGIEWIYLFRQRHNSISLRTPEATSLGRATSFNETHVTLFFKNLKEVMEKHNLTALQIYNCDETGVTNVHKPPKILAPKHQKQVGKVTSAVREQYSGLEDILVILSHL